MGDRVLESADFAAGKVHFEDWCPNGSLGDLIASGRKPSPTDALHLLRGAVADLAELHQRRQPHGQFNPWNIYLRNDGTTALGEGRNPIWSLAESIKQREAGENLSAGVWPGRFLGRGPVGALLYGAPEFFDTSLTRHADSNLRLAQADLYAVGATLLQLLMADLSASPHRLDEADWREAGLDGDMVELLRGCLRRQPSKRMQSAAQLLPKIDRYLQKSDAQFFQKVAPPSKPDEPARAILTDEEGDIRPTPRNDAISCMARAAFNLGKQYERKKSDPEARKASTRFYLKAARSGHLGAQNNYAAKKMMGRDTDRDSAAAHRTFVHAAEEGNPTAMYNAAQDYLLGRGTKKSVESAVFWYQRAARAGFRPAYLKLQELESIGVNSSIDPSENKLMHG